MRRPVLVLLPSLVILPAQANAQTEYMVQGRVVEEDGGGIENAIVELGGSGIILTTVDGSFLFEGVAAGVRTLSVEAFGYVASTQTVEVDGDTTLMVVLGIAPFVLDSLVAAPTKVDIEGRIRGVELERELPISGAALVTSQGHETRTSRRGTFDLDVWEGIPLLLQVRAFGYLPLDTVLTPAEDQDYLLSLEPDSLVKRMIAVEISRIEDRAGGHMAVTMRPMNRDDLLRRPGLLSEILRFEYPLRLRRVRCVVVDERALSPGMAEGVLETTLTREVQRIEFLFRGAMLRVYTRDFMRRMLGGGIELRRPTYVGWARPPFCT